MVTSILEEHEAVRKCAGIFDVSNMARVWIKGHGATSFLDRILTKPASSLNVSGAQLCLVCQKDGGIIDDLWVYRVETDIYLIVLNAADMDKKMNWIHSWQGDNPDFTIEDVTFDTAMLAVQGPAVKTIKCLENISELPRFGHIKTRIAGIDVYAARTGYTGEDGFEMITDLSSAEPLWRLFLEYGVKPCGLGARDSLRLEAGMMLYGQDMDISTNPFEAGLSWLVNLDQNDFIGKNALLDLKQSDLKRKLVGFQMISREIARTGYHVLNKGKEVGIVTSGGYAPTLDKNIGFCYVPSDLSAIGTRIDILIRNKPIPAEVVNRKFYRKGV